MEKINIAEILKDCPKGMELDCTIWDNCTFEGIEDVGYINILVKTPNGLVKLSKEGYLYHNHSGSKCVIFPKGKTTWEGFVSPCKFKDGDILITARGNPFILKKIRNDKICESYCGIRQSGEFIVESYNWTSNYNLRFATEEEKQKLFQAVKENGYKWHEETKTLEKLVQPKFKVGDRVKHISACTQGIVVKVTDKGYHIDYPKGEGVCYVSFTLEKDYELAPNKFDINTLVPFESRVLVRAAYNQFWRPAIWGVKHRDWDFCCVLGGEMWEQCIPYEGNEHLLGTTNDCDEFYKNWK